MPYLSAGADSAVVCQICRTWGVLQTWAILQQTGSSGQPTERKISFLACSMLSEVPCWRLCLQVDRRPMAVWVPIMKKSTALRLEVNREFTQHSGPVPLSRAPQILHKKKEKRRPMATSTEMEIGSVDCQSGCLFMKKSTALRLETNNRWARAHVVSSRCKQIHHTHTRADVDKSLYARLQMD
jgi:hypothetical protein